MKVQQAVSVFLISINCGIFQPFEQHLLFHTPSIKRRHIGTRSTSVFGPQPDLFSTGTTAANQFNTTAAAAVAPVWVTVTLCFPGGLVFLLVDEATFLVFTAGAPVSSLLEEGPS